MIEREEALDEIYGGVAMLRQGEGDGVSTEELKRLFRVYATQRPIDEDVAETTGLALGLGSKYLSENCVDFNNFQTRCTYFYIKLKHI